MRDAEPQPQPDHAISTSTSRTRILALVYLSFLLDNVLLTVVVPIVPVYLISVDKTGPYGLKPTALGINSTVFSYEDSVAEENSRVGLLLSSKALVQLIVNPLVGCAARYTGYTLPLFVGSVNLLSSTLLFAFGETYVSLFFARSLQGLASACIGVSGMCLVAEQCQTEGTRSRVMGVILGSVALGVLLGYPFGSFLYDFVGKTAPFIAIACLSLLNVGFQMTYLDLKPPAETSSGPRSSWSELLTDGLILLTAGAIWVSTSAMAVLEPCLPLWLLSTVKPEVGKSEIHVQAGMANNQEATKIALYGDLQKFGQISDYERTLKTANKILHTFPDDALAFHFRIVSLIQLSKFEDVLTAFNKFGTTLGKGLDFEKAYALYRLNKIEDALKVLDSIENPELKHNELRAQVLYRLERFEECFNLYRDVIKQTSDDFDEERQTNLAAIIVNLLSSGKPIEMPSFEIDTYEIHYNIACYLMVKGNYLEAEKKLKEAEKICRESFDEDTPPEEIEDEVSIIRLQQACCLHFQGRDREALSIYTSILKRKPADLGVVAVASSNSIAINRDQNLFDSKKKMKNILSDNVQVKLTSQQKKVIAVNNCLLNIFTNQGDQAMAQCDDLVQKQPLTEEPSLLMKAAILSRENKNATAIKLLEDFAKKKPASKLKMKLAVVQLLLNEGKVAEACKTLESLDNDMYRPAIVSALVSMYMEMGKPEDASRILEKAVSWNRQNKSTSAGDLSALWRHAADLHLRNGQPKIAAASLEELSKINPNDTVTLAQLILAYAQFDPKKANELSKKLPHLVDLTPNVDADALESSSWMMGLKVIKKAAKTDPSPGTPLLKKKSRSKKKKKRLPKNYNPNVDPDPERWLPKHERSTFRKKKDRRNKDVGKGTQGAATSVQDQYDITKMAKSSDKSQPTPSPSGGEGPRQQQRKGAQQKKKKKGGKW